MATTWKAPTWRMPNEKNQSKFENYGLTFDGNTEYINCGNVEQLKNASVITWNCWINFASANFNIVFGKGASPDVIQFYTWASGVGYFFLKTANVGTTAVINPFIGSLVNLDEWNMFTIVFDGTQTGNDRLKIYLNGSSTNIITSYGGTPPATLPNTTDDFFIGNGTNGDFVGSMSQFSIFDYTLSESQISSLYNSGSPINPMTIKPAPVAYYPLGGNASTGGDSTNTLSVPNVAVPDASVFNFNSDVIEVSNSNDLRITGNMTLSAWINSNNISSNQVLISKNGGGGRNYLFWLLGGKIRLNTQSQGVSANTVLQSDRWYHVAVSVIDGTGTFYVNGVADGTGSFTVTPPATNQPFYIGRDYSPAAYYYFDGEISNVQVWATGLSSTEIETLYNSGVPLTGTQPQASNLKAWYKLNQSANWEADTAGNWQIPDAVSSYPQSFEILSNDSIDFSNGLLSNLSAFTISFWYNRGAANGTTATLLEQNGVITISQYRQSASYSGLQITLNTVNGSSSILSTSQGNIPTGEWLHVGIVYDGSNMTLYRNGSQAPGTYNPIAATGNTVNNNNVFEIFAQSSLQYGISNLQVWNTALLPTGANSIQTLYNNGVPLTTAIASDNLKGWWKLDNSATFSTNWSIPDASGNGHTGTSSGMTEQNLVFNNVSSLNGESSGMDTSNLVTSTLTRQIPYNSYSLNFDSGSSNYINIPNNSILNFGTNDHTISSWINVESLPTSAAQYRTIFSKRSASTTDYQLSIGQNGVIYSYNGSATCQTGTGVISVGNWFNVVLICESNTIQIYVNGVNQTLTGTTTSGSANTEPFIIGNRGDGPNTNEGFLGKINNVAIFNEALTSTEVLKLYNSGVPGDLSSFNPNPIAWWSLGSDSYFNGSNWICPDLISTNNGTSANMDDDALIGDAPNSIANGTSTNMAIDANLTGSAPNSSNNSFSVNMSFDDRETSVPS